MHTCVCCQREIVEGELCSDCEAELRTFVEFAETHPVRVVDIMAEFDLDDTQTMELLRTIRPPRAVETLASRLETESEDLPSAYRVVQDSRGRWQPMRFGRPRRDSRGLVISFSRREDAEAFCSNEQREYIRAYPGDAG
ncbi:MAG TPA: hypothetical protein VKQ30_10050 [Ktedonobacterales bacterium]|nr:hypothetical protein [Ktedonobacterales bacterium]